MEPVTSVAAFIARYGDGSDSRAAEILASLGAEERRVIGLHAAPPAARPGCLARLGWSEAYLRHVEQRAFVDVRRALQRRGLLRP